MITKRKRLDKVTVTFSVPERDEPVLLAGSFNDWTAEPLTRAKDGTLKATVSAAQGDTLEFRYVTASGEWFDDEHADDWVPNEHGTVNGVVRV